VPPEEIIRVMNVLARLAEEFRSTANQRISLELALVKAASRPIADIDEILAGVRSLKDQGAAGTPAPRTPARSAGPGFVAEDRGRGEMPAGPKRHAARDASYENPSVPDAPAPDMEAVELWDRIREEIKAMGKAPLASKMQVSSPGGFEDGVLTVTEGFPPFKPAELELINQAASNVGGIKVKTLQGGPGNKKTLAEVKQQKKKDMIDKIKGEAVEHPLVKSAMDLFGGEVVEVLDEKQGT